jgi:hypothetical protein
MNKLSYLIAMMTIMYPKYEQHDHDQNDWGFFVNLDDLYDHQQLSQNNKYIDNYKKQQKRINYMSSIREVERNVGMGMDIEMVDDDEFGWYVPDKLLRLEENEDERSESKFSDYTPERQRRSMPPATAEFNHSPHSIVPPATARSKLPNKFEQMYMQRDMDIRVTDKITKININIEYDYDDNNAFMKGCLNTCIVLGLSIGCSIFIVLF